jgi:hypothetical protein
MRFALCLFALLPALSLEGCSSISKDQLENMAAANTPARCNTSHNCYAQDGAP